MFIIFPSMEIICADLQMVECSDYVTLLNTVQLQFIHSSIHSGHFYSAPSGPLPLKGENDDPCRRDHACSLNPLRILRAHGLSGDPLFQVTRVTTINRILHAGPALWGFASAQERERIKRFCRKLERAVVWQRTVLISTH